VVAFAAHTLDVELLFTKPVALITVDLALLDYELGLVEPMGIRTHDVLIAQRL